MSQVAQTILAQLGGARFAAVTGASEFIAWPDALSFKLPASLTRDRINRCYVRLTPADLYHVKFAKLSSKGVKVVGEFDDVYCDQLQDLFEARTGLSLSLCRVRFG